MWTGVQFTGNLNPNQTGRWFTFNWNPAQHVVWYMMPTTVHQGVPEVQWSVSVERVSPTACTYWITVSNLTANPITFEGRYAVLG